MRIGEDGVGIMFSSLEDYFGEASKQDFDASATLRIFKNQPSLANRIISELDRSLEGRERLCDLGCGFGFVPYMIGGLLAFKEVYGVDLNNDRLTIAEKRLYKAFKVDLEADVLPFPKDFFDLVTTFGVLEHLRFFDNPVKEAYRILKPEGIFLVSIPNLGDWVDRIRLLLGLQPHSTQISKCAPIDHIHSCTLTFLEEFLAEHGFIPLKAFGAKAVYRSNKILRLLDNIFSRKPSLSIRFFLITQKKVSKERGKD